MPQRTIEITYPVLAAALGLDPHIRIENIDLIVYGDGRQELMLRVASDTWSIPDPAERPLHIDEAVILPANALREARMLSGIMRGRFGAPASVGDTVRVPVGTGRMILPQVDELRDFTYTVRVPARGSRGEPVNVWTTATRDPDTGLMVADSGDRKAAQRTAIEAEFARVTLPAMTGQPLRRLAIIDPLPVPEPEEVCVDEQLPADPVPPMSTPRDDPNPFADLWQQAVSSVRDATAVAERSLYGLATSPLVDPGWRFPVVRPRDPQQLYSYYDPPIYQVWSREQILFEAGRQGYSPEELAEADGGLVLRADGSRWSLVSLIRHDTPEPDLERLNRALVRPNRDSTVFGRPGVIRCRWCHSRLDWAGREPHCTQCGGNL